MRASPTVKWRDIDSDVKNRVALVSIDGDAETNWSVTVNGSDSNGDYVRANYLVVDNLENISPVDIKIGILSTTVSPFTRANIRLTQQVNTMTLAVNGGIIELTFSERDLGIPNEQNQLASGNANMGIYFRLDGTTPLLADADFGGFKGRNAGLPTLPGDLVNRQYIDNIIGASPALSTNPVNAAANVAAINASLVAGNINIPVGTWPINDEITIPDNRSIYGAGERAILKQLTAQKNIFILGNNNIVRGVSFQCIQGVLLSADPTKDNGIFASGKKAIEIAQCYFDGFNNCGVQVRDCFDLLITANKFVNGKWNWLGNSGVITADINFYSPGDGGKAIITDNRCYSDNSQGIAVNVLGCDHDIIIGNNICIALDANGVELTQLTMNRRHGIFTGYGGAVATMRNRLTVTGNICRNSQVSGIYHSATTSVLGPNCGVVIVGNICSKNGQALGGQSDGTLCGGIVLLGGANGDIIANNSISDFAGAAANDVGAITYICENPNISATIIGNAINKSATHGIVVKSTNIMRVDIVNNSFDDNVGRDINIIPSGAPTFANGPIRIMGNAFKRINATAQCIFIESLVANMKRTIIRDNSFIGFNKATVDTTNNVAIYYRATPLLTIRDNSFEEFYVSIRKESVYNDVREYDAILIDDNIFTNCFAGTMITDNNGLSSLPCENNIFTTVTNPFYDSAGYSAARAGIRCGGRIEYYGDANPPWGKYALGDRVRRLTSTVGASKGLVCTTAGSGINVNYAFTSEGNL